MTSDQRWAEFQKFDFETQYQTYICGQQRVEPPDMELGWIFARQGSTIVKPLESKLADTNDDETIRDIVRVFSEMSEKGTYNVAADKPLMEELSDKVTGIRDPTVNVITREVFDRITSKLSNKKPSSPPGTQSSPSRPREER